MNLSDDVASAMRHLDSMHPRSTQVPQRRMSNALSLSALNRFSEGAACDRRA